MKTIPGDIVYSTDYGEIKAWIVLRYANENGKVRVYKLGQGRYDECMTELSEDTICANEEDAIKQAIVEENKKFYDFTLLHEEKLNELYTKLENIRKEEGK